MNYKPRTSGEAENSSWRLKEPCCSCQHQRVSYKPTHWKRVYSFFSWVVTFNISRPILSNLGKVTKVKCGFSILRKKPEDAKCGKTDPSGLQRRSVDSFRNPALVKVGRLFVVPSIYAIGVYTYQVSFLSPDFLRSQNVSW